MINFKTLVLGASLKEDRYSNKAVRKLVNNNIETVAFGLKAGEISGIEINTQLKAFDNIHTVTLYLNPKRQEEYYDYIVSLNPKRVIFNPGTENTTFQNLLSENGIAFEEACTLVMLSIGNYKTELA
ncbi:MAG: CoA-binding protein [Chitinophagales bacterium]